MSSNILKFNVFTDYKNNNNLNLVIFIQTNLLSLGKIPIYY